MGGPGSIWGGGWTQDMDALQRMQNGTMTGVRAEGMRTFGTEEAPKSLGWLDEG